MLPQTIQTTPSKARKKTKSAFTLVELIVVITILAILGTIGFLSIGGYSSKTRDSARVADVSQLAKSLDLSAITVGNYPTPDNYFTVTYSGSAVWYQGTAGASVIQKLHSSIAGGGLDAKPVDPLKNTDYTYSTLAEGKAYQIKAEYEGDLSASLPFVNTAHAAPGDPTIAYVRWNFGGLLAKTSTGTAVYVLAVPSIITGSGIAAGGSVATSTLSGTLLFNGKALKNSNSFNPSTVVFTGSKANAGETGLPSSTAEITTMMNALQAAYTGSDIKSTGNIGELLNASGNTLVALGTGVVKDQLGGAVSTVAPVVDNTPLYTFTAHTFTNCGTVGNHWPSLAGCRGMYNAAEVNAWKNTYLTMTVNGIQEWTVPVTASYRIEANGAKGGDSGYSPVGGNGARILGTFNLTKGDKIKILVGQIGANAAHDASGGGGSFVTTESNSPLIVAGGGGGGSASGYNGTYGSKHGQTTGTGSNTSGGTYTGGNNGSGGTWYSNAGGGGGLTGNGGGTWGGKSFTNNGVGGTDGGSYLGGFGGGGSGGGTNGAGGGGGYSGGAACPWSYDGGGGGSYNAGTSPSNTAAANGTHGTVIITKL